MSSDNPIKAPLEETAETLAEPFRGFVTAQSAAGWLLLAVTMLAIVWANSPWRDSYFALIHAELGITLAGASLAMSLQHWVADGLMAVFFFLLGLELKRELLVGQLSESRRAVAILCAALGGMLVPATLFLAITFTASVSEAWGIPVATDTAFALMVLVLLGERIPIAARAFLVGLAIVDDLGAITIIALFYSEALDPIYLAPTAMALVVLAGLNLTGVRKPLPYALTGLVVWWLFLRLGLHGTLAGVAVALAAPVRPAISRRSFVHQLEDRLEEFEATHDERTETIFEQPRQQELALDVLRASKKATVPLRRWETTLQTPVSFAVMPTFAFMNAGVAVTGAAAWASSLSAGIFVGLVIGKPLGILLGLWIGKRLGIADLPQRLTWSHIGGIGMLGGIGFTMSLFVATLSFGDGSPALDVAKQGIIGASLVAGLVGFAWLRWVACTDGAQSTVTGR